MYSGPGLSKGEGSAGVAVLDTIHGAGTLAGRMVDAGIRAEAMEVYHGLPDLEGYDIVAAPVHLWPGNGALEAARRLGKRVITHHRAVGELLAGRRDFEVFEVTGTRGKTTSALILSRILSRRRRVVSHTTRGIELWEDGLPQTVSSGLSITPANVILAFEAARSKGAGYLVCEVSLGGTGLADYGMITSFSGDYLVAGGTLWASTAKLQMVSLARPGSRLITGPEVGISSDLSFGLGGDVVCSGDEILYGGRRVPLQLQEGLDTSSYLDPISAAAAASVAAGLGLGEVSEALEGFGGLEGRMKRTVLDGVEVYDNSNSGLKVSGVKRAMDYATDYATEYSVGSGGLATALVVGEESKTVCEGMDVPRLVDLIRARRGEVACLVLVGERLVPYAEELGAATAGDLASGRELARASGADRILLCVKCFR